MMHIIRKRADATCMFASVNQSQKQFFNHETCIIVIRSNCADASELGTATFRERKGNYGERRCTGAGDECRSQRHSDRHHHRRRRQLCAPVRRGVHAGLLVHWHGDAGTGSHGQHDRADGRRGESARRDCGRGLRRAEEERGDGLDSQGVGRRP